MNRTLIILKPDCMAQRYAGEVIGRFEKEGFSICACKMIQLSHELLKEHYAHVADRPFFPELAKAMSARPVIVMILEGEGVIDKVRELLGPTDPAKAPKGTIRGDMGTDPRKNVVHASDSPETADIEIKRFFEPSEIYRL